jgi:hypothetical protein
MAKPWLAKLKVQKYQILLAEFLTNPCGFVTKADAMAYH